MKLNWNRLLTIASILDLVLFVPLAWWAHKHPVDLPDLVTTHMAQKKQPKFLRYVIRVYSTITASAVFLNILVVPTALILWKQRLRLEAVMTVVTSWALALVRFLVQQLVDRPRPSPLLVRVAHKKNTKSFPSGHTTTSVSFWGWLLALGMVLLKGERQKALLSIPALFVIASGPSRVYLGEHWATDVFGGYLLGGGWTGLCFQLYLNLRSKGLLASEQKPIAKSILSSHW